MLTGSLLAGEGVSISRSVCNIIGLVTVPNLTADCAMHRWSCSPPSRLILVQNQKTLGRLWRSSLNLFGW